MGIFCAILLALILILIHSIPLLLIIGIPAVLFVLICAAGFGLCCVRHSIESIELTGDFMILEYYKNSKELIKWDEIAGIEPFNGNPICKVMCFLHGNNRPVYTQLGIHLESGITMNIPLTDFYDDELDTIVDMLASKVTRIPESGTGLSDHKIDFRTRKAEADTVPRRGTLEA